MTNKKESKEKVEILHKHKNREENNSRELTIVPINYSEALKSNDKKETLMYMSNLGLVVLEELIKIDKEDK